MRIESYLLLVLAVTLSLALPTPLVYSSAATCYLNELGVQYPVAVGGNTTFTISTSFSASCSGNDTRLVRVQVFDGVDGSLLSTAVLNRTSSTVTLRNVVRAPIIRGYWYVTGQASIVNAATYGATGWGFRVFVNAQPPYYPPAKYNPTPSCHDHSKRCDKT